MDKQSHWENIYQNKASDQVSWYQDQPIGKAQVEALQLPKDADIVDIGGGEGFLVDELLKLGYSQLRVLDISAAAIARAQERLGPLSSQVQWEVSDVLHWNAPSPVDLWYDRAAFHFLTDETDIAQYKQQLLANTQAGAHFIIGTFSTSGPTKCSGIPIRQYEAEDLKALFAPEFEFQASEKHQHHTPFDTVQDFVFCRFIKK